MRILPLFLLIFGFLFAVPPLAAQTPSLWDSSYIEKDFNYIFALSPAARGGYLFGGSTFEKSGDSYMWLSRIDSNGKRIWNQLIGPTEDNSIFYSIQPIPSGYVIGANITNDMNTPFEGYHDNDSLPNDAAVAVFDDTGGVLWAKCYGGTNNDVLYSVIPTYDGGYAFVGNTSSTDGDIHDYRGDPGKNPSELWVEKLDDTGAVVWEHSLGGSDLDLGVGIAELSDHSIAVIGNTRSTDGDITDARGGYDIWVVLLDRDGKMVWQKSFGTSGNDIATGIAATRDGNILVAGHVWDESKADNALWAAELGSDGHTIWQTNPSDWTGYVTLSMTKTPSDGLLLSGRGPSLADTSDIWVVELDKNGHLHSSNRFALAAGGESFHLPSPYAIVCDSAESFTIAGNGAYGSTPLAGFIARFPALREAVQVGPLATSSFDIYPNPASNIITIRSNEDLLNLRLINVLGDNVRSILTHGERSVSLDVSTLPRGVYYLDCSLDGMEMRQPVVLQ